MPASIQIRQVKYLNNIVEQDHHFIKKRVRSMLGLKSFRTAKSILSGIEAMHGIKKGQLTLQDKSVKSPMKFIHLEIYTYFSINAIFAPELKIMSFLNCFPSKYRIYDSLRFFF